MGRKEKMMEYEPRRLENTKRNEQMLVAPNIQSGLNDLTTAKRQSKSYKQSTIKKLKTETSVGLRRSLRSRGLSDDIVDKNSLREQGPLQMKDACSNDDESNRKLIETISLCSEKSKTSELDAVNTDSKKRVCGSVDVEALQLKCENVARLVPGRIMSLRFFPTLDMSMVVAGNMFGNVGFWNINSGKVDIDDGIYLYRPHPGPISGIAIDPFSISKVYSSCYNGFIRLMDVEKEIFDMVHYSEDSIYSISLSPNDTKSLYFSEGMGVVSMWDMRAGKTLFSCNLHDERVNTLDFINSGNDNLFATSSTDGTACIWDLRHLSRSKPLKTVDHKKNVHSAYFSPTGKFLATTSIDDKIGLFSGANYEDTSMIYHNNKTPRWISRFRGIWGWDDTSIFIGNMKKGIDVISAVGKKTMTTLQSNFMSAIPCRLDAHPYKVGMLAGATSGGQVYIWTL